MSVDHWKNGQTSNTWKIADTSHQSPAPFNGLRFIDDPFSINQHTDYYPYRYNSWFKIHENSTVASLAFHLMVVGGYHPRANTAGIPSIYVPKIDWFKTERIFQRQLEDSGIDPFIDFFELRTKTAAAAVDLGYGLAVKDAVLKAWDAVGVVPQPSPPSLPDVDVQSEYCYGWVTVSWPSSNGADWYEIQNATYSDFSNAQFMATATHLSCRFKMPGTGYRHFRVRPCSYAGGCGGWTIGDQVFQILSYCY